MPDPGLQIAVHGSSQRTWTPRQMLDAASSSSQTSQVPLHLLNLTLLHRPRLCPQYGTICCAWPQWVGWVSTTLQRNGTI